MCLFGTFDKNQGRSDSRHDRNRDFYGFFSSLKPPEWSECQFRKVILSTRDFWHFHGVFLATSKEFPATLFLEAVQCQLSINWDARIGSPVIPPKKQWLMMLMVDDWWWFNSIPCWLSGSQWFLGNTNFFERSWMILMIRTEAWRTMWGVHGSSVADFDALLPFSYVKNAQFRAGDPEIHGKWCRKHMKTS